MQRFPVAAGKRWVKWICCYWPRPSRLLFSSNFIAISYAFFSLLLQTTTAIISEEETASFFSKELFKKCFLIMEWHCSAIDISIFSSFAITKWLLADISGYHVSRLREDFLTKTTCTKGFGATSTFRFICQLCWHGFCCCPKPPSSYTLYTPRILHYLNMHLSRARSCVRMYTPDPSCAPTTYTRTVIGRVIAHCTHTHVYTFNKVKVYKKNPY